jgi:hypothetical protein
MMDFGNHPISVARPGGPIEAPKATGGVALIHPGRYSYSHVLIDGQAFPNWLEENKANVRVNDKLTATAATLGAPYYVDYEFFVDSDVLWPLEVRNPRKDVTEKLEGLPTWLPSRIDFRDWVGLPPTSSPDWDAPGRILKEGLAFGSSVMSVVGLVGGAYLVYKLVNHDGR